MTAKERRVTRVPGPVTQTCLLTPFLNSSRSWDCQLGWRHQSLDRGPCGKPGVGWHEVGPRLVGERALGARGVVVVAAMEGQ